MMPLTPPRQSVTIGQRYRPAASRGAWVVVGLTADHAGNPHAQLALETNHTRVMTIACAGLRDRRLYEQLTETTEHDHGPDGLPAEFKSA